MTIVVSQTNPTPGSGMTFLQLVQRLKLECGVSGSALVTTINQAEEISRLVTWINSAWMDIQNEREDWEWMRTTTTFPTVAGQAIYPTSQCNATNFGMWARNTFRNYANPAVTISIANPGVITLIGHNLSLGQSISFETTGSLPTGFVAGTDYYVASIPSLNTFTLSETVGSDAIETTGTQSGTHTITSNNVTNFSGFGSEIFMSYLDYETWRDSYYYGALRQTNSRPEIISIGPNKEICCGPVPAYGYTIVGDYFVQPTEMTFDTDKPSMPNKFHVAIVYRAMMSYGAFESAPEVYQRGETEFNKIMRRLMADQLPEVISGGALA